MDAELVEAEARARIERVRRAAAGALTSFASLLALARVAESPTDAATAADGARIAADTEVMLASVDALRALVDELRLEVFFLDQRARGGSQH